MISARVGKSNTLNFGAFSLDVKKKVLWFEGETVSLPLKALEVLTFLVENALQVVTKEEILDNVWGDKFVEESNLTHYIYLLRKAFRDLNQKKHIYTVPRCGYRFVSNVTAVSGEEITKNPVSSSYILRDDETNNVNGEAVYSSFISSDLSGDELEARLTEYERSSSVFPEMIDACNLLAANLRHVQVDLTRSLALGNRANDLSDKLDYAKGKANALAQIGHTLIFLDRFAEAKHSLGLSVSMFKKLKDDNGIVLALNGLGLVLIRCGWYLEASETIKEAFDISEVIGDPNLQIETLYGIGELSYYLKDYDFSIELCREALSVESVENVNGSSARFFDRLGLIYSLKGNHQKALENLRLAMKAAKSVNDIYTMTKIYSHLAGVYNITDKRQRAFLHYEEAIRLAKEIGLKDIQVGTLEDIVDVYLQIGDYATALFHLTKMAYLTKEGGNEYLYSRAKIKSVLAYLRLGETDRATSILNQIWTEIRGNIGCELPPRCQHLFSEIYESKGEFYNALKSIKLAQKYREKCLAVRRKIAEMLSAVKTQLEDKKREKRLIRNKNIEIAQAHDEIASQNDEIHQSSSDMEDLAGELRRLKRLLPVCDNCSEVLEHPNYIERLESFVTESPNQYGQSFKCLCCD